MGSEALFAHAETRPVAFATVLGEVVKRISRQTPAPRPLPFFGLDLPPGCGTRLLDRLSELGIFRFYERVLEIDSGIGGAARWLARRRGCHAVGVEPSTAKVSAARRLTRRAHLETEVGLVAGAAARLPFADGVFTHAWSIERLHGEIDVPAVLREVLRVIRPGGGFAVQDWVGRSEVVCLDDDRRYETLAARLEALRAAGFDDVRGEEVEDFREEPSAVAELARRTLETSLDVRDTTEAKEARRVERRLAARSEAARTKRLSLVQIFATKPS